MDEVFQVTRNSISQEIHIYNTFSTISYGIQSNEFFVKLAKLDEKNLNEYLYLFVLDLQFAAETLFVIVHFQE